VVTGGNGTGELELKIVDESRAVHYVVLEQGRRTGEIARPDFNGCIAIRLDGAGFVIRNERRAADVAQGRSGLLRALWSRLFLDERYRLLDGTVELARIHSQSRVLRPRPIVLRVTGDRADWHVPPPGRTFQSEVSLRHGAADIGRLKIPGLLRERIQLPAMPLARPVAVALAWVVHQTWGNDPYAGGGDA
jgi:hypothetical protein